MGKRKITWIELVVWAVGIEAVGAILSSLLLFREEPLIGAALLVFVLFTVLCFIVLGRGARTLLRAKDQTPVESGDVGSSENETEKHLWDQVPDKGYDREMLRLWHGGYTAPEIEERIGRSDRTIRNRLTELRKEHGEKIVPKRRSG